MLAEISRDDFINEFFRYQPGEHLVIVSPTGGGKTHLMHQLLGEAMAQQPHLKIAVMMPKPQDVTTRIAAEKLNLRVTPTWPPKKKFFDSNPPSGHVVWPVHQANVDTDTRRELVGAELRKALDAQYWAGDSISVIDDAHSAAAMMGLNPLIEEVLVNGRSSGSAVWLATQKPSGTLVSGGLTTFAWSSASHLFLGRTPNEADLRRYSEIAGMDPKLIQRTVRDLRTYNIGGHPVTQWAYVSRDGPAACLVGP